MSFIALVPLRYLGGPQNIEFPIVFGGVMNVNVVGRGLAPAVNIEIPIIFGGRGNPSPTIETMSFSLR